MKSLISSIGVTMLLALACHRVKRLDVSEVTAIAKHLDANHKPGQRWILNPNAENNLKDISEKLLPINAVIKIDSTCPLILEKSVQLETFRAHVVSLKCSKIRDLPGYFLGGFIQCDDENEMYQPRFKLHSISNQNVYLDEAQDTYVTPAAICKKLKKDGKITGQLFIRNHRFSFWTILMAD